MDIVREEVEIRRDGTCETETQVLMWSPLSPRHISEMQVQPDQSERADLLLMQQ
jgi:hypothetical protein